MSNKTQLQTNNTALDALITRVNAAKDTAASLPEAGGGGSGGGSVEFGSFTVTNFHFDDGSLPVYPFVIGMTWREWIDSPLNMRLFNSSVGGQQFYVGYGGNPAHLSDGGSEQDVSFDGISSVSLDDVIEDNHEYSLVLAGGSNPFV